MLTDLPRQAAVLISGGLDSCILAGHWSRQGVEIFPLYIRTNLHWQTCELAAIERFLQAIRTPQVHPLVVLDLPLADLYERQHWSVSGENVPNAVSPDEAVYLPGRNALLLVKACVWCQLQGISYVALAPLGTSPFHDARTPFFESFAAAMNCGDAAPITILRPFAGVAKREVMQWGRGLPLRHTFSCIAPERGRHCGRCNKCAERRAAFALAEMCDPTDYACTNASPAHAPLHCAPSAANEQNRAC